MTVGEPDAKHPKNAHTTATNNTEERKDRHSADPRSHVRADAKKHGHGGAFTWDGDAAEQLRDNYTPDVDGGHNMQNVTLQTVTREPQVEDERLKADMSSLKDFPPLGAGSDSEKTKSPQQKANEDKWHGKVLLDMDFAEKVAA